MAVVEIVIDAINNAGPVLDSVGNSIESMGNVATKVAQVAFAALAAAAAGAAFALKESIDAAIESEVAISKLETVLKSTGDEFGFTSAQLQTMALNMQNMSGFSDEAEMSAEAMLLRFENLNNIFPQALQLTNDLAVSLGTDLTAAAQTIGKALDDPASGIGRLNMQFKLFNETEMETIKQMAENGDIAGAQALIMERLTEKIGGAAEAYGNTLAGSMAIAKESFDNLKEVIGMAFLPLLTDMTQGIIDFVNDPDVQAFVNNFAQKLSDLFSGIASGDITFLSLTESFMNWTKSIDWNQLSQDIADGINAVDWVQVGDVIYNAFMNILAGLAVIVTRVDWGAVASAIGRALGDVFLGMAGYVDWNSFGQFWVDLANYLEVTGANAIRDGLNGIEVAITDAVRNWFNNIELDVTGWVRDHIVNPIKQFLGIASPSTVFMEIGKDIIRGLVGGINSLVDWAIDGIKSVVASIIAPFKPVLDLLGIDTSFLNTTSTSGVPVSGADYPGGWGGLPIPGGTGTTSLGATGTVVNQYFNGATINVGSWDQISYDCLNPNPFVAATSGQLSSSSSGGGTTVR